MDLIRQRLQRRWANVSSRVVWIVAFIYGDLLMVLGVGFYVATGMTTKTALIPLIFGIPVAACGALARAEKMKKHAMHAAAMLGLLAFFGSADGFLGLARMASGATIERPLAAIEKSIMASLSIIFVGLCVKSFIDARKRREAAAALAGPAGPA